MSTTIRPILTLVPAKSSANMFHNICREIIKY
jgi:hypothetical protein